mmetsp:Transcript_55118/g.129028  ORF Transcript_55118/g.129028 Transcript_55118/m.129028 type:complete len:520 (+) Transcript_55118:86-1645(+)
MATAETLKILTDSVSQIARRASETGSGVSEDHITAFKRFKNGVVKATGSKESSPEARAVLSPLEPKPPVLRLLVDLYWAKKIYRKQVEDVFRKLLQVDVWLEALNADAELSENLPEELKAVFFEAYDAWEAGTLGGLDGSASGSTSAPVDEAAFKAVFKEKEDGKGLGGEEDPAAILEQIDRGRQQIEALQFRVGDNIDLASMAFESFYKGVNQASHSKATDDDALDRIPMKEKLLEFLVDLIEVKPKYRSRVAATLNRLLSIEGWKLASQAEFSVTMVINQLIADTGTQISPYAQEIPLPAQATGMPQGMRPAAPTNPFAPGGCMPNASSPVPAAMGVGPCANRTLSVPSTNPFGGAAAPGGCAVGSPACAAPVPPTNPFSAGIAVAGRSAQVGSQPSPLPGIAHPTNPFGAAGGAPVPRVNSMEAVASPSMAGPGAKVPRAQSHEQYPLGGHSHQANLAGFAVKTAAQNPHETAAVAGAVAKSGHGPCLFNAAATAAGGGSANNPFDPHNKPRARKR